MGLDDTKSLIAVPARLESKRLPRKVLKDIGGQPMLKRVLDQCNKSFKSSEIILCTDSSELLTLANEWGFKVFLTSKECSSGSARIASVIKRIVAYMWGKDINKFADEEFRHLLKKSFVINVQGDQPFIDPNLILSLRYKLIKHSNEPIVVTPIYKLTSDKIHDPNVVKTIVSHHEQAIYFSRAAIPFNREVEKSLWHELSPYYGHVGIYGFRADVLEMWDRLPCSNLEKIESLEQLRLIEAGIKIFTFKTEKESFSIDTLQQLNEARDIWNNLMS